ncbi:MAG: hypothetical protein LRY66_12240 [Saccharospirillaceae bacterium]|nr:hypothetical protein [Saccharospirillaceae bacterium]MCD8532086.1 hypothetical protein [Saccharospirillaceae bacterium]
MKNIVIGLLGMLASTTLSLNAVAANPHDEYYSNDIFTAIEEARQRTHHYDYSHAQRYNRSTSQSIPFSRLLNKEMAQTIVETPDSIDVDPQPHQSPDNRDGETLTSRDNETLPNIQTAPLSLPTNVSAGAASVTITVR